MSVFFQEPVRLPYGKRAADKELVIYPLSIGDQVRLSKTILSVWQKVGKMADADTNDASFLEATFDEVIANFDNIFAVVCGFDDTFPAPANLKDEVTNMQLASFVQAVWEMNYGSVRKNFSGLIGEFQGALKPTVTA